MELVLRMENIPTRSWSISKFYNFEASDKQTASSVLDKCECYAGQGRTDEIARYFNYTVLIASILVGTCRNAQITRKSSFLYGWI